MFLFKAFRFLLFACFWFLMYVSARDPQAFGAPPRPTVPRDRSRPHLAPWRPRARFFSVPVNDGWQGVPAVPAVKVQVPE